MFKSSILNTPKTPNSPKPYTRSYNPQWALKFMWIDYDQLKDVIYCKICKQFGEHLKSDSFTNVGFSNWKNETEKLKKHDDSGDHKTSVTKSILFEKKKRQLLLLFRIIMRL